MLPPESYGERMIVRTMAIKCFRTRVVSEIPSGSANVKVVPPARRRRVSVRSAVIALMLFSGWGVALSNRGPLLARWWGWRLARAESGADQADYLQRLIASGPAAVGAARALAVNADPWVRCMGVGLLRQDSSETGRRLLTAALTDADDRVRELAAIGLAARGDEAAVDTLAEMIATGKKNEGIVALSALRRIGTARARAAIRAIGADAADASIKAQAIEALGALEDNEAVEWLIDQLADDRLVRSDGLTVSPTVGQVAARALEAITGKSFDRQ